MCTDLDGVRVVSNAVCDFLQKVPQVTDEVFRFGTESAASILLDAVEQLEMRSPKADDNIQLIRHSLAEAVDMCVSRRTRPTLFRQPVSWGYLVWLTEAAGQRRRPRV